MQSYMGTTIISQPNIDDIWQYENMHAHNVFQ